MKTAKGILVLSHVGFSFMEDLIELIHARQLGVFVLSSLPVPEHQSDRLRQLRDKVESLHSTSSHVLGEPEIDEAIARLRSEGHEVLCCISVWEGYRHLMARANAELGVPDLDANDVLRVRNKLALRNRLADAGLSRVRALPLTQETLERLKNSEPRYFIKPVFGLASYGAFPLWATTRWEDVERVAAEAREDLVYASILGSDAEFLVEDYVEGQELSFEVLLWQGVAHVVAIHEKCRVTQTSATVLEDACTSPPVSLSPRRCAEGVSWVNALLSHLNLNWGAFHVEARHDGTRWELIEINPRVGGSLISSSVQASNGEHGMLALWLDELISLASADTRERDYFLQRLAALSFREDGTTPARNATFFRVYFAKPGRITGIRQREVSPNPIVAQVLLQVGDQVVNASREVFLGQLLWRVPVADHEKSLPALLALSEGALDAEYAS